MKRILLFMLILALSACAHAGAADTVTREVFTMDTYITVTCTGERAEEAAEACKNELLRLNGLLSVGAADSEVSAINRGKTARVSEDTAAIIRKALEIHEATEGLFDISVYPLMELWGFTSGRYHVPDAEEAEALLSSVDASRIVYDAEAGTVSVAPGQSIDLGGIAKGFASDRMMLLFEEYGISSGCVSLGGNVQVYGMKPNGKAWKIGIQDPFDSSDIIGALSVSDCAVITSGSYQRYFTDENTGIVYHHIIDPRTGFPADSDIVSVTVVTESGILGDALSTSCFIMGKDAALEFWRKNSGFELVIMTSDKSIYVTEGLADVFTCRYNYATVVR